MPQRFFDENTLRPYGLTPGDLRRHQQPGGLVPWRLSETAVALLRPLLERTGFKIGDPIHVHETRDPAGFVFTQ
jgi:hypothetical protein